MHVMYCTVCMYMLLLYCMLRVPYIYVCMYTSKLVLLDSIADCAIAYVMKYACMNVYYLFV